MALRQITVRFLPPALLLLLTATPALPVAKEIIQIQRDLAILQEQVRQIERQHGKTGERIAVLETLLKQNLDVSNRVNATLAIIERSIAKQGEAIVSPVSSISIQVDALASQFGGLRDAIEEQNSRMGKVQQQIEDIKNHLTMLPPPSLDGGPTAKAMGSTSAETLYSSALSDYQRANWDLARNQFTDYLRQYGNTVRAADAQYFLADIYYQQEEYAAAVKNFDMVLERFPAGPISADAQFKKGLAFLKLERRQEAANEFRNVVERFPNSSIAPNARGRLAALDSSQAPTP